MNIAWIYPCNPRIGYTLAFSLIREMKRRGIEIDEYNTVSNDGIYNPDIALSSFYLNKDKYDAIIVLDLGFLKDARVDKANHKCPVLLLAGDNPQSYPQKTYLIRLKNYFARKLGVSQKSNFGEYYGHELTAFQYDGVLCPDLETTYLYRENGLNALWFPYWADSSVYYARNVSPIYDVVTVMKPRPNRQEELLFLENSTKYTFNNGLGNYQKDAAEHYSKGKIVFNKSNYGEITIRIFEALSCNRMLLTDELDSKTGIDSLLIKGHDYITFKKKFDLDNKINYLLRDDVTINKVAERGYKTVIARHTEKQRVDKLMEYIMDLKAC